MLKTLYFKDYRNKTVFNTFYIFTFRACSNSLYLCNRHITCNVSTVSHIFNIYILLQTFKSFALIAQTTDGVAVEILNQRVNVIVDHTCCMIIDIC